MKESYPLVSVCILSYNRPQGLKNTLKAICGQSYANLEIIISDDYSPNAEVEKIANEFATSDTRVKFYRQKQNIGIIENHRFLLSKVTGKYMMWACDDDWWHMDFIKICVDALEKNDDAVLCTTNSSFLKNAKKVYTDHYENISTVGISENKTRFRKVFNTIFWWNNTFYGLLRSEAVRPEFLKTRFAFDLYFILELALEGQFIKLPPFYFRKTTGGYGNTMNSNLKAIQVRNPLNKLSPKFTFIVLILKDVLLHTSLNITQKIKLAYFLLNKSFTMPPVWGKQNTNTHILKRLNVFDKQRRRDKIIGKMFPDQDVLNQIYAYNIPIHEIEYRHDVKTLLLNKLGITLNTPAQLEFLRTYPWAIRLLHDGIFMFKQDKNRRIFLEGNGITIQIPHSNYVYIAYEIFLNKIYNLKITKPSVVFDIGMNAGIASLFFANEKFVHKVIGYEPFEQTYNLALENFRINPGLKGKIEAHNFGLGDNEMQLELPYTPNASEHSGEKGIPDHILETRQLTVVIEKIQIKKASEVLCKEIENWKHHDIFLKMDCEGCENSVLADLYENKVLERFHAILMEWHDEGSEYPEKILHQSGFKVISLPDNLGGNSTGMLYAIKTNP